jgi:hypothetical protein
MGSIVGVLVVAAIAMLVAGIPGFVIAQRRGSSNPWVAFVPFVGLWIVLCESAGQSGWFGVLAFIPMVGLIISLWMAIAVPPAHGRSQWWTAALVVPGVNILGYWLYAFTLPVRSDADLALAGA